MAIDPYQFLGVGKDSSDAEIKAAYRKLAKQYHPDLNPGNKEAAEKFRDLNAAHDLISDRDRRDAHARGEAAQATQAAAQRQYSQQRQQRTYRDFADRPQGSRYDFAGGDFDMADLEGMFGGLGGRFGGGGNSAPSADVQYTIGIDFLDAARGAKQRVTMPDGKTLEIKIPEGIREGQKLRLKGQGAQPSGDAYVTVHIRPHAIFTREGDDVTVELPVGFHESILGAKIEAPTVHGPVAMTIPQGTGNGATLRLKGKGIKGGDQYVKVRIAMPKETDAALTEAVRVWAANHPFNPRQGMEQP